MQDRQADRVTSPPKSARVEDGKIRKIRSGTKSDFTAIQHFNGKTYACESCKRGHRVQKCDHGRTRPISETNQPGRPSGGQKRGCRCPRNCACTTKTCKCERDCACTQEMYLIVRVDGPQTIKREATSTPRPVWEDDKGNTLTLKKVWADANGRQIDDEEYQKRRQRMKEREEGILKAPEVSRSSCCSSKKAKEEEDQPATGPSKTTSGGCRHRENVAVSQPSIEKQPSAPTPQSTGLANDSWVAACSCGSGCSCLYCPDHPNNATSIKHTQQQVKNLAEQAFVGDGLMPASFVPESTPQSCMGGRPTFFLSKTPGMSQQQLARFFSENSEPGAIYLTYPIQQHSWSNQPASAHCSHAQSPSGTGAVATPDPTEPFAESLEDMPTVPAAWDLLPDDPSGTWNFSDGQLGNTSFSWTDLDASYGTDYSIGQATVASMTSQNNPPAMPNTPCHNFPTPRPNMDTLACHTPLADFSTSIPPGFGGCCSHSALQDEYPNFDMSATPGPVHEQMHRPGSAVIPGFAQHQSYTMQTPVNPPSTMPPLLDRQPQLFHPALLPQQLDVVPVGNTNGDLKLWNGYDPLLDEPVGTNFKTLPIPNSPPIANGA